MPWLTSHLDQEPAISGGLGEEPSTAAASAPAAPAETPAGNEIFPQPAPVPLFLGMTKQQLILVVAAAAVTYFIMRQTVKKK